MLSAALLRDGTRGRPVAKTLTCLLIGVICLMSSRSVEAQAPANAADRALEQFFRSYLDESFALSPMLATSLGDHRFDALLDDVSAAALKQREALARKTLERLPKVVDYRALSRSGQVDFEILRDRLQLDLWLEEVELPWQTDPRTYTSLATECVYTLLTQSTLPPEVNVRNALARIQHVPALLAAGRENLRQPPRVRTETAIQQTKGAVQFLERDLADFVANVPQRAELLSAGRDVAAAVKRHLTFLEEELLPRSTGDWRLGKDTFYKKLPLILDAGLSADDVLVEAEAEFVRVRRDMLLIARQLWFQYFPNEAMPPDDEEGRRSTIERVIERIGREHGEPESLVRDARKSVATIKQFITDRDLLRLPEPDVCQIIEMPEFQRGNSIAFLQPAPPLDATAASIYAISPPPQSWSANRVESFLSEYNRHMLQILTIHEAYPGHYVQLEYANRHPSLIRRVLGSGVYAEGWANYTEQMLLDQGYGSGELALRLMQLKFYLRGVTNAILDHRMHCTEISDEQALTLLTKEAFQSEGEARLKIIRAKLGSCQLSTYFVGRTAFMRLRRDIQRELGAAFDLGRYHEAVLSLGSVPVKYMPELTRTRLTQPR